MSQPPAYNRVTSFTTDQAQAPTTPTNGANIDAELNGIKTTLDQILTNIALIQRDDTHLANASVGLDQLDTTVVVGFNSPTPWVTAHAYAATADSVFNGAKLYRCAVAHTSGTFATDLAAGKWTLLADFSTSFGSAVNITFTPAQGLASANVQAAIEESKVALDDVSGWRNDISGSLTTAGTSTAYVLATGTPFLSLAAMNNQPIVFIPHTTCGVAATLAVDGLAAKKIRTATGVDLTAGALVAGTPYLVVYYNAVGEFLLVGYTDVRNNVTINGTLAVTGAATLNGTVALGAGGSIAGSFTGTPTMSGAWTFSGGGALSGTFTGSPTFSGNPIFSGKVALTSTTAPFGISGGTTAQRSGSPTEGDVRYNTTLHGAEYWNGTAWIVLGQAPTVQRLTSGTGATFTPTAGAVRFRIRMVGPGAGGAGGNANNGSNGSAATSFQVNSTGTAWTAAVGVGGTANGGAGGLGGNGGTDGSTGTKVARFKGGDGGSGGTAAANAGGIGGSSAFGGAGRGGGTTGQAGFDGSGSGGGGGNSGGATGGGGGSGEYVEFLVSGMTTATYTIGTGGAAGIAGGQAGGKGGDSIIIVEEFYS